MKEGIVVIDKPTGITSHDVVSIVRKRFKIRQVGHAGTLDPLATGVLIVLLGSATKLFNKFVSFDKGYHATLMLGVTTTTADIEGEILKRSQSDRITREQIEDVFRSFEGHIKQIPPMVSAVKVNGVRLYKLARSGIQIERQPRDVRIHKIRLTNFNPPEAKFCLECSKGTYVRQLAQDVGDILGCGACITQIQRVKVGPFEIQDAVALKELNESHIRIWES